MQMQLSAQIAINTQECWQIEREREKESGKENENENEANQMQIK